jgi:hypothetical protein
MVFPDGGRYEGAFAADAMEGEGVYTYPNGDVYSGMYAAGLKVCFLNPRFLNHEHLNP